MDPDRTQGPPTPAEDDWTAPFPFRSEEERIAVQRLRSAFRAFAQTLVDLTQRIERLEERSRRTRERVSWLDDRISRLERKEKLRRPRPH